MSDIKPKVAILYWGNRGGGKVLTDQLVHESGMQGYELTQFSRPIVRGTEVRTIPIYSFWKWISLRRKMVLKVAQSNIKVVVIPMASPWDIFLGRKLIKSGVSVTRIIHDANPHPGDKFPPKFWIKLLCNDSSRIVTLSKYVKLQLIANKYAEPSKITIGSLPAPILPSIRMVESKVPRLNFLFIGRGRSYKGLDLLLASWPTVGNANSKLIIAGEGHQIQTTESRVSHIDRWLTDQEVIQYIYDCDLMVLPYIEASQSGLVSIAHALHRPVIVTPVGGLVEQVLDGVNGIVAKAANAEYLSQAMNQAINFDFSRGFKTGVETNLLKVCVEGTNL